jgi:hypothetical protein
LFYSRWGTEQKRVENLQVRQELNEERQQIAQIRHSINQQEYDLKAREAKLAEIEPLIPSIKEFQNIGVTFDLVLSYMMAINEKSALENIDPKTAAYNIVHDFRDYRLLGSLRKAVEKAEQQLSALNAFTTQKQQAIMTLMNLQLAGFSEKQIMELTGLVNMWNKHRPDLGSPGLDQGNGSSSTNGSKLDDRLIGN